MRLDGRVLAVSAWRPSHQHPKEPELIVLSENVGERAYKGINFDSILSIILDPCMVALTGETPIESDLA